eukprot:95971-Amphidinium_carterae.2
MSRGREFLAGIFKNSVFNTGLHATTPKTGNSCTMSWLIGTRPPGHARSPVARMLCGKLVSQRQGSRQSKVGEQSGGGEPQELPVNSRLVKCRSDAQEVFIEMKEYDIQVGGKENRRTDKPGRLSVGEEMWSYIALFWCTMKGVQSVPNAILTAFHSWTEQLEKCRPNGDKWLEIGSIRSPALGQWFVNQVQPGNRPRM